MWSEVYDFSMAYPSLTMVTLPALPGIQTKPGRLQASCLWPNKIIDIGLGLPLAGLYQRDQLNLIQIKPGLLWKSIIFTTVVLVNGVRKQASRCCKFNREIYFLLGDFESELNEIDKVLEVAIREGSRGTDGLLS